MTGGLLVVMVLGGGRQLQDVGELFGQGSSSEHDLPRKNLLAIDTSYNSSITPRIALGLFSEFLRWKSYQ